MADGSPGGAERLEPLWEPLALRGVTIPNRIACTATTLQYAVDRRVSPRHVAFYRERAIGGVGLLFTEQLSATPLSETPFAGAIAAYDERNVEGFRSVIAALAGRETRLFGQLVAGGGMGDSTIRLEGWGPVRGPSRVPAPGQEVPEPLTEPEIARIVHDHAVSARHLVAAGLHGIEVHGAHGWLVGEFLSPQTNTRQDAYGGSVAGRCRLAVEIGRAVRDEVGDEVPVGLALTYDECIGEAGITLDETLRQLEHLAAAGVFDFFDLSLGASHSTFMTIASMAVPENHSLETARRAREVVRERAAILVAGRVVDLEAAAAAVAVGMADLIGMTRAHLADPHLVARALGRTDAPPTRCVGCNVCVGRALEGREVACVVNPATGREAALGHGTLTRAATSLRVTVVGGGPAGLRVAATSARRGHEVELLERDTEPGGHLRQLAWLPTRDSWSRAVEDLRQTLERHGGRIRTGCEAGLAECRAADVVVVATGATWDESGVSSLRPGRPGIVAEGGGHVLGLDRALAAARRDPRALGRRVAIADETGAYAPLGLAQVLAEGGAEVHLVTPAASIGAAAALQLELEHVLPRLRALGVELTAWRHATAFIGGAVRLEDVLGGEPRSIEGVATLVLALRRTPLDALHAELVAAGLTAHLIGDARSPRVTAAVVLEAEELARRL